MIVCVHNQKNLSANNRQFHGLDGIFKKTHLMNVNLNT